MSKGEYINQKERVSLFPILLLAPISLITFTTIGSFFLLKSIKNNYAISGMIIKHLENLLEKKPNNAIILFLLKNKSILINNIERSYIADKIDIWLAGIITAFILTSICSIIAFHYYDKHKNSCKTRNIIKRNKGLHFSIFGCTFFATLIIITGVFFIPLATVMPDNLSTLLCKGINYIEHDNNPLIEIIKEVVKSTFEDEHLIIDIRSTISKWLTVILAVSTVFFVIFAVSSYIYYSRNTNDKLDSRDRVSSNVTEKTVTKITGNKAVLV